MTLNNTFNPWLTFSLLFLGVWLIIYLVKPVVRREMLWSSIYEHARWYAVVKK